tara:strand:+ start:12 stop:1163 length:1152 start_codon:yes stop_codon:yes gene_type:complete
MKINIFGSTGNIGSKTLKLIENNFPNIQINLLTANKDFNKIYKQIKKYDPKYVYLDDIISSEKLKKKIKSDVKILSKKELSDYLLKSKSELTILSIAGYKSLNFLEEIIINTDNLGLVSKEAIVSAGHLFKRKKYFYKTNIFPLDSEHFSLFNYLQNQSDINSIKKIYLTASGGPFLNLKYNQLENVSFNEAIKHPKWKMGYKNSIDSATLVNKCLEVIEAHYLFNIPYEKIDILVHPESLVHSIIEHKNYLSNMVLFKNDMKIPIFNFLSKSKKEYIDIDHSLSVKSYGNLSFQNVKNNQFPIYNFFKKMKKNPVNVIKFNIINEKAVELFKDNRIKYTDIYKIIGKLDSLNLYSPLKNIKDIIKYHDEIQKKFEKIFYNKI